MYALARCSYQGANVISLSTVTYGTGPASFLATNCLNVLRCQVAKTDPDVNNLIQNNFYMDVFLGGASTVDEVRDIRSTRHTALESARFVLRKYASNCTKLLDKLDQSLLESSKVIEKRTEFAVSTLGLKWDIVPDVFQIQISNSFDLSRVTKRIILLFVSKQYNPLGFIAPVSVRRKMILQLL